MFKCKLLKEVIALLNTSTYMDKEDSKRISLKWQEIARSPVYPVNHLPNQTVKRLKEILADLERIHNTTIPVTRTNTRGVKKGAPLKQDYIYTINAFLSPPLLPELVLYIFAFDFHPAKFRLLSKEMHHKANTEDFYRCVCRNRGYTAKQESYRDFFLKNIDVSHIRPPMIRIGTSTDYNNRLYCSMVTGDGRLICSTNTINAKSLTAGQLRHIVSELFPYVCVPVPEKPEQIQTLTVGYKLTVRSDWYSGWACCRDLPDIQEARKAYV